MRRFLAAAAVAAALSSFSAPARASLIWQGTFDPDPSGQTSVNLYIGFPMTAPTTKTQLTVRGGTIADIGWESLAYFAIYDWWELPPGSGNFVLMGDSMPGGAGQVSESVDTTPTSSIYRIDTYSYNNCYGSGFHAVGVCAWVFQFGYADLKGVLVNADQPFTLTLSSVPEPSSWAMMLGGSALLGLALRGRRSRARAGVGPAWL